MVHFANYKISLLNFLPQKIINVVFVVRQGLTFYGLFQSTTGEAQEKSSKEIIEVLNILEEQCLGDKMFFGGSSLGLVDISFGWLAYWFEVMEEVVGTKLLEPTTFPRLHAWAQNFKEISLIKENLPDRERLAAHFKRIRESFILESRKPQ